MTENSGENLNETWIYSLQDEDLISYCNEFEIDLSGSYRECRDRFVRFLNAEHKPLRMLRLLELQEKHCQDSTDVLSPTKQLKEKIDRRYQRFDESFEHFACELQKLMQELNYSERQQFITILRNSQPVFQHFINRTHCSNLHELMTLAGDLEEIRDCMLEETRPGHTFKQLHYDASHIYATIYVCEIRAVATIDTGASRSFLSENYVKKLGKRCRYVPVNADVTLADGSVRVLKFAVEGQVRMGNISCEFQFIIMPDASEDIILGLDFCMHVGATFSCGGETIQLENGAKAIAVPESESSLERRNTKLPSIVLRTRSRAEKFASVEESAAKPPLSSKRKREESRSQNDKNNLIPTPYQTRQPLLNERNSGIPLSSNQNVDNIEKQYPFNPMVNSPSAVWSPHNSYNEGNFSNQQCRNEPRWNGPDNYSTNFFLNNQGPNGTGWNGNNAFPLNNFDNNQGQYSNGWTGPDSFSANNFSNNQNWNHNQNGPSWNGNQVYSGNNFANNQGLNSLAWNNTNAFPANNSSNNHGPNLEQTRSNRDASFVACTPIQPLLKGTKPAQEKPPPPNDFSKYDTETADELNKIVEQASKGENLLQELSMLQTIRGQLFKILVYPNRKVYIMEVPKVGSKKVLNTTKSASSISATSSHKAQNKKSTSTEPQQSMKTTVVEDSMEKKSHEIASLVKDETQIRVLHTASHDSTDTNESEAVITVEKDSDELPSAAKRQKPDTTRTQANLAPPSSEQNSSTKTTATTDPIATSDQTVSADPTVPTDPNEPSDRTASIGTTPTTTSTDSTAPTHITATTGATIIVTADGSKEEKHTQDLICDVKHQKPDEAKSPATAELHVLPHSSNPTSSESTNLNANASIISTGNEAALNNQAKPDNPDAPNDFSMYDAETTAELRKIVVDFSKICNDRRRKRFRKLIRDQVFTVTVSRGRVFISKKNVSDIYLLALQNKLLSQGTEEKNTSTHAIPHATQPEKSLSQKKDKDEYNVPQLVDKQKTKPQNVTYETPGTVPSVDLDLSMYDEETAVELRKLALENAAGDRLRNQISCLREVCGRKFRMIIQKNRKVTIRPHESEVGDNKDKT